ncbi:uncharacterized protein [Physcomitrium patens]|uniref:Uncharacterized protein n=1 Tax=Physcomitrium patens TaxID=3218 RepID=A0A2K1IUJ6_PHYPA|nr:uncharacterized protein LOC112273667 [Physcomitrium patens]XP_024358468.1 uncharacterized protein LOC112273667 [Physcomitrium patens]PNR32940.1 hypothetical protein PHYPA_024883 [Physcomitrium patens]|eukprot:XP_024358467.1 uncharacterized protein LOC112273667 [Physcomitrella patens]
MARTKKTAGGRKQKHATTGVAKNKVSPAVKFTDMRANAGQKLSIAGAKMSEKMTHFRANVMLKLYRLQHPTHPVKRVAAKESILNMKAAATERRRQKVARAIDVAARKRAQARERRAVAMARHT